MISIYYWYLVLHTQAYEKRKLAQNFHRSKLVTLETFIIDVTKLVERCWSSPISFWITTARIVERSIFLISLQDKKQ